MHLICVWNRAVFHIGHAMLEPLNTSTQNRLCITSNHTTIENPQSHTHLQPFLAQNWSFLSCFLTQPHADLKDVGMALGIWSGEAKTRSNDPNVRSLTFDLLSISLFWSFFHKNADCSLHLQAKRPQHLASATELRIDLFLVLSGLFSYLFSLGGELFWGSANNWLSPDTPTLNVIFGPSLVDLTPLIALTIQGVKIASHECWNW